MMDLPARLRPTIRIETLVLAVVVWLIATANGAWWSAATAGVSWSRPSSWLFVGCVFAALVAAHFALIAAVSNRWIVRPMLTLLIIASAAAAWYMRSFAVILDPTMMQNVLRTDRHEAADLLNLDMIAWVAFGR